MSAKAFRPVPDAVAEARSFARESLALLCADHLTDVVSLIVSELATNCVLHGRTAFVVDFRLREGVLRVEVTDYGLGEPSVANGDLLALSGRGLRLVAELADRWGVVDGDEVGKTVWLEIDVAALEAPRVKLRSGA